MLSKTLRRHCNGHQLIISLFGSLLDKDLQYGQTAFYLQFTHTVSGQLGWPGTDHVKAAG